MTTIATGTETTDGQADAARPAGADAPKRRFFRIDDGPGQVTEYPDPDPRLTDERVIATLKAQISRLANMAHAWKDEGEARVCVFTPRPGTKGGARRDHADGAAVRGAIGELVGALGAVPTRRLALFDLLPEAYRGGTIVPGAVVALGPALDAAADEAERYAERCRVYGREVADALGDGPR